MTDKPDVERRNLLRTAAVTAAVLAAANAANAQANQPSAQKPAVPALRAFESQSKPKPPPFDPAKLKGLSERMLGSHWENNYGGSVKALGVVTKNLEQALADKDTPPYIYNELKREHLLRTGSVVLHEYYFANLGGSGQAGASARRALADSFRSFDTWETEFRRIGVGLGGGSGWVVLGHNTDTGQLENYWLADHAHSPAATLPLLVMDMYEHSYQMDYGAAAAKYIDTFFANIQWDAVSSRIEATQRLRQT